MRIGIDLGGTKIVAVALDGGREVARVRVDTPRGDYEGTLGAIVSAVAALESRIPSPELRIPSVGIGIPGTISASSGRVKNANSTWLIGQPLQRDLELRLGRAVRIANDANCFAMSEAADGAAAGAAAVFGVIVGTGVGGGVVVHGALLQGANGIGGEWGHNPLPWAEGEEAPGPICYCGQRGCIETFLSGPALSLDHERRTGTRLTPPEIVVRASDGDAGADETMARYEHRMARALATVINLLDPDVIVLGGGMSNIERLYVNVPRLWARYVFAAESHIGDAGAPGESRIPSPALGPFGTLKVVPNKVEGQQAEGAPSMSRGDSRLNTRLVRARHGDASGVRGAAWLWPVTP